MPRGSSIVAGLTAGVIVIGLVLLFLFAIPIVIAWLVIQIWPSYGDSFWYLVALIFFLMIAFGGSGMSFRAHRRNGSR